MKATKYYAVIGNRDHIKYQGEKRPFWEFLDKQPDGYLSSLAYLPTPYGFPDSPMIADCGAWSYRDKDIPQLKKDLVTPEWALTQYQKYFKVDDLVIAPDHMLIPLEGVNLDDRRAFNINSAKKFLPIANAAGFKPMATVHGMDLEERLINIGRLYEIGYRHFAFGGLAARASQKKYLLSMIESMASKVRQYLPDAWIHILGLSSPDYVREFNEMNIDSCDGSSHFKQAFTAGTFFQEKDGKLVKHNAVHLGEEVTAPSCNCTACSKLREMDIDTRSYGSNERNMGRAAHNLNMLIRAQKNISLPKIALVSCVAKKLSIDSCSQDIYVSPWFKKCRGFVEKQDFQDWHILSAKHHVLDRTQVIQPYEMTLHTMTLEQKKEWAIAVCNQLLDKYPNGADISFFAGETYRKYLIPMLGSQGFVCRIPLQHKGIGSQLAYFDSQSESFDPQQLQLFT